MICEPERPELGGFRALPGDWLARAKQRIHFHRQTRGCREIFSGYRFWPGVVSDREVRGSILEAL